MRHETKWLKWLKTILMEINAWILKIRERKTDEKECKKVILPKAESIQQCFVYFFFHVKRKYTCNADV